MSERVMKNVKKVGPYLYFQKAGLPRVRLQSPLPPPGQEAGSALEKEVKGLLDALSPDPRAHTFEALLREYELQSPDFKALAPSTRAEYLRKLRELSDDFGELAIADFTPSFVYQLRNTWARRGYQAANHRLTILNAVLAPAVIRGQLPLNPVKVVPTVRRPSEMGEPHPIWRRDVVDLVIETCIAQRRFGLARAVAIARYVGARRGDLIRLTRASRKSGRIQFLSGKRKVPVDIPEDPALTAWLAAIPAAQPLSDWERTRTAARRRTVAQPTTLVFNKESKPYTEDGVGQELAKVVLALFKAARLDSDRYDLHGLRHTRGVELALAGCTDAEGAAQLGHASPNSFSQYRRQADRIRMADNAADKIRQLRERTSNEVLENQLEKSWKNAAANER